MRIICRLLIFCTVCLSVIQQPLSLSFANTGKAPAVAAIRQADLIAAEAATGKAPQKTQPATGRNTGYPIPRFISLRSNEVNLRSGPGTRYPIKWVIKRRHLPVKVIDEFGHWRRVQLFDGSIGWIKKTLLSPQQAAIIIGDQLRILYRKPGFHEVPVALLEPGVMGLVDRCQKNWCALTINSRTGNHTVDQQSIDEFSGWIKRELIWGVGR